MDHTVPDILIVDDEPQVRNIVATYLERDGFAVRTAADGGDASDEADEAPDATDSPPEEPTPSSESDPGSVPTADVVPEAVSRQPPAPAEEQK